MSAPIPVFDGHNDVLLWLHRQPEDDFLAGIPARDIDFPRAQEGGMYGGFFAIFAPDPGYVIDRHLAVTAGGYQVAMAPAYDHAAARMLTDAVLARLDDVVAASAGKLGIVRNASDLVRLFSAGHLAMAVHFEGAEAIDADLTLLPGYYDRGLRSLGLVWSRPNSFGHGVPFAFPASPDSGPGLTAAGRELVRACNQMGIVVDMAHLNEQGFWDVAKLSDAPLCVTHTGVHAICPVARNLTDRQIDAVGASGGVIGIAYDVAMVRRDGGLVRETPLTIFADHILYIADRIGVEHVALGSDFDGATIAASIGDVRGVQGLLAVLRERGLDDAAVNQVAHGNWQRLLTQTWK